MYSFIGGRGQGGKDKQQGNQGWHRVVNEGRILRFAEELDKWTFDEARAQGIEANIAKFQIQKLT